MSMVTDRKIWRRHHTLAPIYRLQHAPVGAALLRQYPVSSAGPKEEREGARCFPFPFPWGAIGGERETVGDPEAV